MCALLRVDILSGLMLNCASPGRVQGVMRLLSLVPRCTSIVRDSSLESPLEPHFKIGGQTSRKPFHHTDAKRSINPCDRENTSVLEMRQRTPIAGWIHARLDPPLL